MEKAQRKTPISSPQDVELTVAQIEVDADIQQRCGMRHETVRDYAEDMLLDHEFPPLAVFRDPETGRYWLADGFHRLAACKQIDRAKVQCKIREGTRNDAMLCAATANRAHGLRRTNADKRKAVNTVLQLRPEWSDHEIAREVKVSPPFVGNVRRDLPDDITPLTKNVSTKRKYVNKYGNVSEMDVSGIGQGQRSAADDGDADRAEEETAEAPPASSSMSPEKRWEACVEGLARMVQRVPVDAYGDLLPASRGKVLEALVIVLAYLNDVVEKLPTPTEADDLPATEEAADAPHSCKVNT